MVSRRNLFSAILMMGVLFVLIQFFLVVKEQGNQYFYNEHYAESFWWEQNVFEPKIMGPMEQSYRDHVIYIGGTDADVYPVILAWCRYRKMNLKVVEDLQSYANWIVPIPRAILINGEEFKDSESIEILKKMERQRVPMVFVTLPEAKEIEYDEAYLSLIGVDYLMDDSEEELVGYHVLDGFLLGGETFYEPVSEDDKKRMDLNLDIPRYHVFNNTKSYIIGMFEETPDETDLQPSLLWRYSTSTTNIYVVNGDFIRDMSGMGYLSAIMAEISQYDIYPVVNAQELTLVNFPSLSDENRVHMMDVYSRDLSRFYSNLAWPGIVSMIEKSGMVPTCYTTPRMDYTGENVPQEEELSYYLRQLKEKEGEMGLSMDLLQGTKLTDKLAQDAAFFEGLDLSYQFGGIWCPQSQLKEAEAYLGTSYLSDIRTVVTDKAEVPVGYLSEDLTLQAATADLYPYYYSEDLKNKGYETALGYANIVFHMDEPVWSEEEEMEWQKSSKIVAGNLSTYWKNYSFFDRVTVSEANKRIRSFLALDYKRLRVREKITITVDNFWQEAWFVLRLHEEKVSKVSNGDFTKMEDGAYLIHATDSTFEIIVESDEDEATFFR